MGANSGRWGRVVRLGGRGEGWVRARGKEGGVSGWRAGGAQYRR